MQNTIRCSAFFASLALNQLRAQGAGVRSIAARSRPARRFGFVSFFYFPAANSPQEENAIGCSAFFASLALNQLRAQGAGVRSIAARSRPARRFGFVNFFYFPAANSPRKAVDKTQMICYN